MYQLTVFLLFLVSRSSVVLSTIRLGTYDIDESKISVSGISSGAYFAVQFHVAFSRTIMGVGVFAGGPYYCAKDSALNALSKCSLLAFQTDVSDLIDFTHATARSGTIDPVDGMRGDRILIVRGKFDALLRQGAADNLVEYYKSFVDESDIATEFELPAQHAIYTDDYGHDCRYLGKPFINNCNYSAAYETLQHVYGSIIPATSSMARSENLMEFDQSEFFGASGNRVGLDKIAYVYVPTACQNGSQVCRLHIALHGCWMSRGVIGTTFVRHAGYNHVAEINNIIILYPQTRRSLFPLNPNSCWDWYGYTSPEYTTKQGPQMAAVKAMVNRLTGSTM